MNGTEDKRGHGWYMRILNSGGKWFLLDNWVAGACEVL